MPDRAGPQSFARGGTPLFALQELGGLESAEMVRKYAHLAADHLTPWADRLVEHNVPGTNPPQKGE